MATFVDVGAQGDGSATAPIGADHAVDHHVLADEHDVLLDEVRRREQLVRAALGSGRWPDTEVAGLVAYLRFEVLDQTVTEERLLFPLVDGAPADRRISRLVAEHRALRNLAQQLADTAAAEVDRRDLQLLVDLLDDLEELLVRHMRTEEAVLSGTTTDGVEGLRRPFRCHRWFTVTEGPDVDLDALPREHASRAALERFSRMRYGDRLQLRAGWDLDRLAALVERAWPREFGWACLEAGPELWRAEVTRREPE